ncbi:MAG: hypothetical protein IKQ30_07860 [Bacteroidales bacterium]|nr:hypothetical protein [Bacteroidales bacterium]
MTKIARTATILSSILLVSAITFAFVTFTHSDAYAQFLESYKKLSIPEQQWVKRHPFAAFRTHKIADSVKTECQTRLNDADLDGDLNGGMVDAFKHTLWMALTAQKIGYEKALKLGQAHEDGNRLEYESDPTRARTPQDSIASRMDMLNNVVGARIGDSNPDASQKKIIELVKQAVMEGKCWKIKKKDKNIYIDADGKEIAIHDYDNNWAIPKVLIPSNKDNKTVKQ